MTTKDVLAEELAAVRVGQPAIANRVDIDHSLTNASVRHDAMSAILKASNKWFKRHKIFDEINLAAVSAPASVNALEAAPSEHDRTCVVCWEAEREVRFLCGHAVCCRRCVARLGTRARCPVCKMAVGGWVEEGAHLAAQPTYRQHMHETTALLPVGGCGGAFTCRRAQWYQSFDTYAL